MALSFTMTNNLVIICPEKLLELTTDRSKDKHSTNRKLYFRIFGTISFIFLFDSCLSSIGYKTGFSCRMYYVSAFLND